MKKAFVFLMAFAVIGTASTTLFTENGDFESTVGPAEGWGLWNGGPVIGGEPTSGGNPGQYVSIDNGAAGWAGWYNQDGVSGELAKYGIPPGADITVECDIIGLSGDLGASGLKVETWNSTGAQSEYGEWPLTVTTSWATYSTIPYTVASNGTKLVISMMNLASDLVPQAAAAYGYDNISVKAAGRSLRPTPWSWDADQVNGPGVIPGTQALSWENPAGTTAITGYYLESSTPVTDPNLGPDVPGLHPSAVALTITGLNSSSITTQLNKYYYWKVHPDGTEGFEWRFQTVNSAPVVVPPADQYIVSTGVSPMVLTLDATITDDGGTPTILWEDITAGGDKNPATTVTINSSATEDTTVNLTNADPTLLTGYYQFRVTADDGVNAPVVVEPVIVGVYPNCQDAAIGDPGNTFYDANGAGDLDGSCKVDLVDFALFAASWLDCDASSISCP